MSDSISYNIPEATRNGSDAAKNTTNDHVEGAAGGGVIAGGNGHQKAVARTFVTLDVKPWGMLVGINTSKSH